MRIGVFLVLLLCCGCGPNLGKIARDNPALWQTFTYQDTSSLAEIKIQNTQIPCTIHADRSYIVTILEPLPYNESLSVGIIFLDGNGFEVASRRIGNVVPHFCGTLRGSVRLPYDDCKKIKNAALSFHTKQ